MMLSPRHTPGPITGGRKLFRRSVFLPLLAASLAGCASDGDQRQALRLDLPLEQAPAVRPAEKLSLDLRRELETSGPEQSLRVLAELSMQLDVRAFGTRLRAQGIGRLARRDSVVSALRRLASFSETQLQPLLDELRRKGWLDSHLSLSVVNGFVAVATPRAIHQLAEHDAVTGIWLETREGAAVLARVTESQSDTPAAASSWALEAIGAPAVWARGLDGTGVVVGIINAGASARHEQLRGNYRGGGNSWHDPLGEVSEPRDAMIGHGTQVLSAAVGQNLVGRALGVAPGAEWIACRGVPGGRFSNIALVACADWMVNVGQPDVLINPWVLPDEGCDTSLRRIVDVWRAAEILPVFAAGNYGPGMRSDRSPANYVDLYPGGAAALAVGGLAGPDSVFPRSSRGPNSCDGSNYPGLVAPALQVTAAFPLTESTYILSEGTSVAAGLVAGASALLFQRHREAGVHQLEEALLTGAIDLGPPGPDDAYGFGRLYVPTALDSLDVILGKKERPNSSKDAPKHR